jgi:competence protein ComEC
VYNNYINPSIAANIGIFPIIIFFMGKINMLGFLSNLFVLPLLPFLMIYGFLSIFLYSIWPWEGIILIENWLLDYIFKVSEISSSYGMYLSVEGSEIKYLILILFIVWLIVKRYKAEGKKS